MTSCPSKSTLQRLLDPAGLHFTTSERSGPFWQSMLHNYLSRSLSFLDWTTAMLFWLDFHQTQSKLHRWFRMQRHDWSSTSPKEPMLHLSLSPCTGYQLQLASSSRHWCLHIEQPQAQHPPTSTHYYEFTSPPEVLDLLVSDASWYHHREAQNHSPEHSRSPFLAWWNDLPTRIRNAESLSIFKQQLKTPFSLSFSPSLASFYLFEQCLRLVVPLSVCLFKINRFMYSPIVSLFG